MSFHRQASYMPESEIEVPEINSQEFMTEDDQVVPTAQATPEIEQVPATEPATPAPSTTTS